MGNRLAGKVALITGAARGMGAAEATLFAEEGARLALTDVREEELKALAEKLRSKGYEVLALAQDVSDAAGWATVVEDCERAHGGLDVLVNNAGILSMTGVEATTDEEWERVIAVNQRGVWLGMKHTIPAMKRRGSGSIINLSSIYGLVGGGGAIAYQATKGAVRLMTKTAAIEYAREGIRINSLHPGVIDTPMLQEGVPDELKPVLAQMTPMGRMARPEEIAHGALFLASDDSSFMTGSELVMDGGYTAQ